MKNLSRRNNFNVLTVPHVIVYTYSYVNMDKPKVILFYDLCRLCLENPGVDEIFTKTDLANDIFLCTGVNVTRQDNLPQKICVKCLEIVVNAKQLRVLATANDIHLNSLFDDGETFVIGFNKTDQNQGCSVSRKSSTDSDRTVKLEIVENEDSVTEEVSQSDKKRKISDSSENNSKPEEQKISVRKDLFNSSLGSVTSSTKDATSTVKLNFKVKIKRFKTESGDCFQYICSVCQKKFIEWKKYYLHQKTHNRSIMCPLDNCGKKFATKGDLEKHVRTHTGEKPFQCDLCDKRFAQRGSLKSHKLAVHAQSPDKS